MKIFVPTNLINVNIHYTSRILRPRRVKKEKKTAQILSIKMVLRINAVTCPKQEADTLLPTDARTSTASNGGRT